MDYIYWNVSPTIVEIGPLAPRWYGLLFALGFVVGFYVMRSIFQREGKPEADLDRLLLYMLGGTIVGARLGHVLFYEPGYYLSHPLQILMIWRGGLASHGGLVGILVALWLYARNRPGQPYLWLLDRIAVPAVLAGAFIRLGNLFNSEILGRTTDVPWAFVFVQAPPPFNNAPRHPAQLYESISYVLIFAVLMAIYRRSGARTPRGLLAGLFLVLVFSARFLIEFVKVRQAAFGEALPLSVGQLLSLPAILVGVALLLYSRRHRSAPDTTSP